MGKYGPPPKHRGKSELHSDTTWVRRKANKAEHQKQHRDKEHEDENEKDENFAEARKTATLSIEHAKWARIFYQRKREIATMLVCSCCCGQYNSPLMHNELFTAAQVLAFSMNLMGLWLIATNFPADSPATVSPATPHHLYRFCAECYEVLREGHVPHAAIANGNWRGSYHTGKLDGRPEFLRMMDHNALLRSIISPVRLHSQISVARGGVRVVEGPRRQCAFQSQLEQKPTRKKRTAPWGRSSCKRWPWKPSSPPLAVPRLSESMRMLVNQRHKPEHKIARSVAMIFASY